MSEIVNSNSTESESTYIDVDGGSGGGGDDDGGGDGGNSDNSRTISQISDAEHIIGENLFTCWRVIPFEYHKVYKANEYILLSPNGEISIYSCGCIAQSNWEFTFDFKSFHPHIPCKSVVIATIYYNQSGKIQFTGTVIRHSLQIRFDPYFRQHFTKPIQNHILNTTNDFAQGIIVTGVCDGESFKYIIIFDKVQNSYPPDLTNAKQSITPLINHHYTDTSIRENLTTFSWYYQQR